MYICNQLNRVYADNTNMQLIVLYVYDVTILHLIRHHAILHVNAAAVSNTYIRYDQL